MAIEVTEHDLTDLTDYAKIPIAFEVRSVLDINEDCKIPRAFILSERDISVPYVKDYDAIAGRVSMLQPVDFMPRRAVC